MDCIGGKKSTFYLGRPASLWIKGQSGHSCWGEKATHVYIMWDFKHDCLRNTFFNIHPKIIFADIQGFTLLFVPLWNIFGFFRQIYRKTIILSILEMVMTAIIIIYGANLSRVVCVLCGGVELPAATHIAVSVPCVLFVSEYHRVPNVFLFIFF